MSDDGIEMEDGREEEEIQEEIVPAIPIEKESLGDITEFTGTESAAREIITPSSHKAAVWKYFGFQKDDKTGNSGKLVIENKATCKLCFAKVARSGGTTNLHNHLRSHHREEYNAVVGDSVTSNSDQTKISDFCKHSSPTTKLPPNSKRAQELTAAVVEFVVRDLKPIRVVDSVGFLHLMDVAEPRYIVPCRRTVSNYLDKKYFMTKSLVQQELKEVQYLGLTTDMWTSRANDGYISLTAHYITPSFEMKHRNLQSFSFPGSHSAVNIAKLLEQLAANWKIDLYTQVTAFTTDNAKNITNAITENLMLTMIPCAGHTLNLVVQRALSTPGLATTLGRCI